MDHKGWHSRGYLPHFDSQDVVQFVTFRLVDSLPQEAVVKLRGAARPESLRDELLDQGWGACWLRSDSIARIVEDAFLVFDGERYRLHAWTIMPNHVHVLFTVLPGKSLSAAAKFLGVSDADLRTQLRDGKSLADIAKAKGKTTADLKAAMKTAITSELDQAVKDKKLTAEQRTKILADIDARLDDLINNTPPKGGPRFRFRHP